MYISSAEKPFSKSVLILENRSSMQKNIYKVDLRFYVLFNSISFISGRRTDDNERLCAMELRLRLRRFRLEG